jgi:hypothetical protein
MMLSSGFVLTNENYFSTEASKFYMSASQFKSFRSCEARALAEVNGEWKRPETTALLVGSYVDAHFEGTLGIFKAQHPDIFKRDGSLKADYVQAEAIINAIENDPFMLKYMSGEKQVIMTSTIEGVPVKVKLDFLHRGKAIVDGKVMKDFEPMWTPEYGKVNFVRAWGYDIQGFFYQHTVQFRTGDKLPFFIAGATKQDIPDKAVISVPQDIIDNAGSIVKGYIVHFDEVKRGIVPPTRCEKCDYCRATKKLDRVQLLEEFDPDF